ncbi:hypothetical protein [Paraburkholderia sp. J63]|nr:hypothetical protein [Paraburkholderia sp. J63]
MKREFVVGELAGHAPVSGNLGQQAGNKKAPRLARRFYHPVYASLGA